jgi:hypothetical protein
MGNVSSGLALIDQEYGAVGGEDSTDRSWASYKLQQTIRTMTPAALAATVAGTFVLGSPRVATNPYGGNSVTTQFRVVGLRAVFPGGVTADSTNFKVLTVNRYPSAGTTATAVAVMSTTPASSGTVVIGQCVNFTITAANAVLDQNGSLVLIVGSSGDGVSLPAGTVVEADLIPVV